MSFFDRFAGYNNGAFLAFAGEAASGEEPLAIYTPPAGGTPLSIHRAVIHDERGRVDLDAETVTTIRVATLKLEVPREVFAEAHIDGAQYGATVQITATGEKWDVDLAETVFGPSLVLLALERRPLVGQGEARLAGS